MAVQPTSATMRSTQATILRTNSDPSCRWLRMNPSLGRHRDLPTPAVKPSPHEAVFKICRSYQVDFRCLAADILAAKTASARLGPDRAPASRSRRSVPSRYSVNHSSVQHHQCMLPG
jgi:hypothetical protein